MNLIREECEKALKTLQEKYIGFDVVDELICFKNLIEECFDNQPLKLEEIRPDDWIWDKKNKEWRQVNFAGIVGKDDELMFYEDVFKKGVKIVAFNDFRSVVFEENQFYRKQVEE